MMTPVVAVATSIDNPLSPKDFSLIKKLEETHAIELFVFLPKVPAQYLVLPSFTDELEGWINQGKHTLKELGQKLGVPEKNQHFVDEILGPDEVFDKARRLKAQVILTSHPDELKQSFLSRAFDTIAGVFDKSKGKEVPVVSVVAFARTAITETKKPPKVTESSAQGHEHSPLWTPQSERTLKGRGSKRSADEPLDKQDEDKKPRIK
jgi:hypothetical protein